MNNFYLEAFNTLGTERQLGFSGAGPIPHSAILTYGRFWGMLGKELDDFIMVILAVDRHFLSVIMPKIQARNQPSG